MPAARTTAPMTPSITTTDRGNVVLAARSATSADASGLTGCDDDTSLT
jgi:hypothetical protein